MLGAREAPLYCTRLLRFEEHHLQLYLTPDTMAFFITGPAVQHAPLTTYIFGRPAWLLDYRVRDGGTVVPQSIWSPSTPGDAQRYCNVSKMPIFFVFGERMALGIQLTQAAAGHCSGLLNGHAPAPVGSRHTTYIRVKVSVPPPSPKFARCANGVPFLVARLRRTEQPDHDQKSNARAKYDPPRSTSRTRRTRGSPVPRGAAVRILPCIPSSD